MHVSTQLWRFHQPLQPINISALYVLLKRLTHEGERIGIVLSTKQQLHCLFFKGFLCISNEVQLAHSKRLNLRKKLKKWSFFLFHFIKNTAVHNCKVQPTECWGRRDVCCSGELTAKLSCLFRPYRNMHRVVFAEDLHKLIFISLSERADTHQPAGACEQTVVLDLALLVQLCCSVSHTVSFICWWHDTIIMRKFLEHFTIRSHNNISNMLSCNVSCTYWVEMTLNLTYPRIGQTYPQNSWTQVI